MGYEGASEVIFVPEEYGLDKDIDINIIYRPDILQCF